MVQMDGDCVKKWILIISSIILVLDQIIKSVIISFITYQETIHLIPKFLYLTYVKNTGGAWSIFDSNPVFLIIIGLICICCLGFYIYKKNTFNKMEVAYYSLIAGGILGNFVDRIFSSGVIDYIGTIFGSYYFPIFNLADICIVCGAVLLLINSFRGDINGNRSNKR